MVIGRYPLTRHQSTQINGQERTDSFTITTNKQQKVHELPEIQIVRQITSIICFFPYLSSDLFCREYVTNMLLGVLAPKRRSDYMAFQSTWLWFYCYQLYLKLPVLNQYNYYLIDLKSIDSRFRYLWSILAVLVNSYPFVWLLSKNLKWFYHPIVWVYMMKVIS
jgi:hypothetical protein